MGTAGCEARGEQRGGWPALHFSLPCLVFRALIFPLCLVGVSGQCGPVLTWFLRSELLTGRASSLTEFCLLAVWTQTPGTHCVEPLDLLQPRALSCAVTRVFALKTGEGGGGARAAQQVPWATSKSHLGTGARADQHSCAPLGQREEQAFLLEVT